MLKDYDEDFFKRLDLVLEKISKKSTALASNLKRAINELKNSQRYLRAYNHEAYIKDENQLPQDEFHAFRTYVRLLRSCTIMCGKDIANEFKDLFYEFFSGERLKLSEKLSKEGTLKNSQETNKV